MVRLLLAMRLSRASVLLSKLLLWSPDIDGEAALWRRAGHTRALAASGNAKLAKKGETRDAFNKNRN